MQPKSSPGVPWVKLAQTNQALFSSDISRGLVYSALVTRIRKVLSYSTSELNGMTPMQLVQLGLRDPIKVFIKKEPHKVAKLRDGKLRIISNVSIVDQLLERILCGKQNKLEIALWKSCPSKPGMGLHDEGMQELYSCVTSAQQVSAKAETDVSGWDWSVPHWLIQFDFESRSALYHAPKGGLLDRLLMFQSHAISNKVFALSDGTLLQQLVPGVQASGSYNTSSSNSRMRVGLAWLIGAEWVIAMGDDDVEDEVEGARAKYLELGFTVKDYKVLRDIGHFDFCSTTFSGSWRGVPSQWPRTLYRYLSHSLSSLRANPELRGQLAGDFRHLPNQEDVLSRCDKLVDDLSKLN